MKKANNEKMLLPLADKEGQVLAAYCEIMAITTVKNTHNNKIGYLTNGVRVILRDTSFEEIEKDTDLFVNANKSEMVSKLADKEILRGHVVINNFLINGNKLSLKLSRTRKIGFYVFMGLKRFKSRKNKTENAVD